MADVGSDQQRLACIPGGRARREEEAARLPARDRAVLAAMASGSVQLVHLHGCWQAYGERDGRVQALGLSLTTEGLQLLAQLVPGIRVNPAHAAGLPFAWLPAEHHADVRDLLTVSMCTAHLVVEQAVSRPRERG